MRDLLTALRDSYDMVIIDAPPVIPITDAPLLTALTDLVVVVIESGRIPLKAAQRMKELLQSVQAPVPASYSTTAPRSIPTAMAITARVTAVAATMARVTTVPMIRMRPDRRGHGGGTC